MKDRYQILKNFIDSVDDHVFNISGFEFLLYDISLNSKKKDSIVFKYKVYNEEDLPYSTNCMRYKVFMETYNFFEKYLNIQLTYKDIIRIYDKGKLITNNEDDIYIPEYLLDEILSPIGKTLSFTDNLILYSPSKYVPTTFNLTDVDTELLGVTIKSKDSGTFEVLIDLKLLRASQKTKNDVMDKIKSGEYYFSEKYRMAQFTFDNQRVITDIFDKYQMIKCSEIEILSRYQI